MLDFAYCFLSEGDAKTTAQRLPDFLELANVSAVPGKVKYLFVSLSMPFQNWKADLFSIIYQHPYENSRGAVSGGAATLKAGLIVGKNWRDHGHGRLSRYLGVEHDENSR